MRTRKNQKWYLYQKKWYLSHPGRDRGGAVVDAFTHSRTDREHECDVWYTVAGTREGVRNTSGFTGMSPPGAPGGGGEARGVPHLGPALLE